jgi:pimeloyl-ACP methyl ester carboxylesterase
MKKTTVTLKRSLIALVVIAVLATLLPACGGKEEAPITVPAGAQAGDLVGLEPCTYTTKDEVVYAADCGTLVVPENRDDPNSRLIALPVIRLRATGSNPSEPIFYFAGGPGEPNMHFSHPEGLIENHDIVMVGYRGVDGSVVLDCPEFAKALKGAGGEVLSEESITNMTDSLTRCAARLQGEGVDLHSYTIPDVIEDMEAARIGLGYERINLLSGSYGTRPAMMYTWVHPESLHRVVMTCVNSPGHFVYYPDVTDELMEHDAELCARDPECGGRTDDLIETMRNVAHNMPRRWLFLPIDPFKVRFVTQVMLFHRGMAASAFDAYLAAEEGDPSGLWLMSLMYGFVLPPKAWGDQFTKGSIDYDALMDYDALLFPPDTILGAPLYAVWRPVQSSDWPKTSYPEELREIQPSDVETVLLSGNMDYNNAPSFAEELLPSLSNGQHVVLSEFGHTGDFWKYQPEARLHMLTTFYDTGKVDDSRYTYQPMDFQVGFGFPEQAKLGVGIVLLVIVIMVAVMLLIVWLVRRRRARQV